MLLGEKEALNFPDKLRFIETGTMHLFAVSGLHIGIITLFIAQLFGLSVRATIHALSGNPKRRILATTV